MVRPLDCLFVTIEVLIHNPGRLPSRSTTARSEERIRPHVILCWLALLLARIAENAGGDTWPNLRRDLDRIHAGTFTAPLAPSGSAPRSLRPSTACCTR